jgi:CelD/BcsL family acetyltransferase involved in cellulose biosynthesis
VQGAARRSWQGRTGRPGAAGDGEAAIAALAADWDELADRCEAPPFARAGWYAAWWRAFGRGRLELLTVRDGGRLVGILPVSERGGSRFSNPNDHTPMLTLLAADPTVAGQLAQRLFESRPRQVSLALLPADSHDLVCCRGAAAERGYRTVLRTLERPLYIAVDGDWAAYERRLGTNLRRDLRRAQRRLASHGSVRFDVGEESDGLEERLEEVFRIESSGWKAEHGTAIASRPETRLFYHEVARWSAGRGVLRLAVLRVDGRAVAFHYALEEHGIYYPLKGGYDATFARCSPGKLVIQATLSRAFSLGLRRYELLGDQAPYKFSWASDARELVRLDAFAPTAGGVAGWTLSAVGRPIARRAVRLTRVGAIASRAASS